MLTFHWSSTGGPNFSHSTVGDKWLKIVPRNGSDRPLLQRSTGGFWYVCSFKDYITITGRKVHRRLMPFVAGLSNQAVCSCIPSLTATIPHSKEQQHWWRVGTEYTLNIDSQSYLFLKEV
jgi:hypothetical protein